MTGLGLEGEIVDRENHARAVAHFRAARVVLPKFSELADPATMPDAVVAALADVDPDAAEAGNLFRVTWHNGADRRARVAVPDHLVLPEALTGVKARIVMALGNRFPMIAAHKVLAAYGCLAPRIVTGQYDPTRHRAIWPSTGNYCRGGVAISRILGCHGVAVLPEGMSAERFRWLEDWVSDPADIVRNAGFREQRQGDLRQVPRAGEPAGQRDLQPVQRIRQLSDPLPVHRPRAGARLREPARGAQGPAPRRLRRRHRLGRHPGGGRLSQGAPWVAHRRGRGARMPDAALQRLWRAHTSRASATSICR